MRFEIRPPFIVVHDDKPGNHVTLVGADGRNMPFREDFSSFSDAQRSYSWAFEGAIRNDERIVFATTDRRIVGVRRGSAVDVEDASQYAILSPTGLIHRSRPVPMTRTPANTRMRETAQSLDEICVRHKCVRKIADYANLPSDLGAYAAIAVSGSGPVTGLSAALQLIRGGYELVEVYVRVVDFEPLAPEHFALSAEWVVVARRRHPSNEPRVVGIMLAKGEADIIPDVVANLSQTLSTLYFFAGDTPTNDAILASAPCDGWADPVDISLPHTDGLRHFLLNQARNDAHAEGDPRPMWVMVVQGDEIYHDDLRFHIMLAQQERATVLNCQVATFLLHESQKEGWDWSLPVDKRLTHYISDLGEHSGFLDFPWIYYVPEEHMRAHPHGIFPGKWAAAKPLRKHYPFRSPEQARARLADRLKVSATHPRGWQPRYENYRNIFVKDEASGRPVKIYHGWFNEAERVEGIW